MQTLGDGFSYVASVASGLGYSLEETTAMLGLLGDNAIEGSMAGTALRKIMLDLSNESSKLSRYIGFPVRNMEDLTKAIQILQSEGFDPMVDGAELVGPRVAAAFNILFENVDGINELTETLDASSEAFDGLGEAVGQQEIMMDTFQGDVDQLNSAIANMQIDIFNELEDELRDVVQWMTKFVQSITAADLKQWAVELGLFVFVWRGLPLILRQTAMAMTLVKAKTLSLNKVMKRTPWGFVAFSISTTASYLM